MIQFRCGVCLRPCNCSVNIGTLICLQCFEPHEILLYWFPTVKNKTSAILFITGNKMPKKSIKHDSFYRYSYSHQGMLSEYFTQRRLDSNNNTTKSIAENQHWFFTRCMLSCVNETQVTGVTFCPVTKHCRKSTLVLHTLHIVLCL